MSEHTPGPWKADYNKPYDQWWVSQFDGNPVANAWELPYRFAGRRRRDGRCNIGCNIHPGVSYLLPSALNRLMANPNFRGNVAERFLGMMGPQASPFDRANQPVHWWEQPPPQPQRRPNDEAVPQPADQPANPAKQPQPSLLQMLMLGGPATYGGTPKGGANPWGWLGSMGMPGGKP